MTKIGCIPAELVRVVLVSAIFVGLVASVAPARAEKSEPRWDPEGIADFSLTECRGRTVTRADLLGKPWLAAFIFTRCAGPCPKVSAQMKILQDRLKKMDILLVTFTVDPDHDTPEVLEGYARQHKADPERWWFLTGDKGEIYRLIRGSFRIPVVETEGKDRIKGFEVIHSTRIMHVDALGRVVGSYNANDDVDMIRLRRAVIGKISAAEKVQLDAADAESNLDPAAAASKPDPVAVAATVPTWVARLPAVNASLNGLATLLLLSGFALIKSGKREAHKTVMLSAFATSMIFLACYLVYHWQLGVYTGSSQREYSGAGTLRLVYRTILLTHVVLAAIVPVLAIMTIWRGLTGSWERHKSLARVTFPIWLYVSVTGVIIYLMLYHG